MVGLLTVLSLAPSIVIMTTSFVRIVVVLSLLRTAMGLQQSPPNSVLISLALFLSRHRHGPYLAGLLRPTGIKPPARPQDGDALQAFTAASTPVKDFMLKQVNRDDLALFIRLSKIAKPKTAIATRRSRW